MKNNILSFRLLNFQSWNDKSAEIILSPELLNIIEAPNETGKSVLFKVIYNMVFPGYWSSTELIRTGCQRAVMIISLADERYVAYVLQRSHYAVTLLSTDGKQDWEDYKQFPQEVSEALGLIVDANSKIILNVIDKDVPLPFIKTSPAFNASLIKAIVEPPEITEFFERLKINMQEANVAQNAFYQAAAKAHAAYTVLEYKDVDLLAEQKNRVDKLTAFVQRFESFSNVLSHLTEHIGRQPKAVIDPHLVDSEIGTLASLEHITSILSKITEIIECFKEPVKDPSIAEPELKVMQHIDSVLAIMQQIDSARAHLPKQIKLPDVSVELAMIDKIAQVVSILHALTQKVLIVNENVLVMQNIKDELTQIREQVGVCPTCGRLLEDTNEACVHSA